MDMTISAGIMMRFAFSMPPFTPRATVRNVTARNTSMKLTLCGPFAMKDEKYVPPSAIAEGESKT